MKSNDRRRIFSNALCDLYGKRDENDKNANPFAINFADYIGKKHFQEVNYDNYYICRNLC